MFCQIIRLRHDISNCQILIQFKKGDAKWLQKRISCSYFSIELCIHLLFILPHWIIYTLLRCLEDVPSDKRLADTKAIHTPLMKIHDGLWLLSVSLEYYTSVLFSPTPRLRGHTSAQHVRLHRAALGLFMELSSRPGQATAAERRRARSAPPGRWSSANVISLLMRRSAAAEPSHPSARWYVHFTRVQSLVTRGFKATLTLNASRPQCSCTGTHADTNSIPH